MAGTKVEMPPLHAADSLAGAVGGGTASSSTSATTTTISAAADSSDNQPSTPQPVGANEQQQQLTQSQQQQSHHPYATHHMYSSSASSANSGNLPHMYAGMYGTGGAATDLQQQQQQLAGGGGGGGGYPSYMNSYESTYYQQPPTTLAAMDYGVGGGSSSTSNSSALIYGGGGGGGGGSTGDYKPLQSGVRYHPYLHTPTSGLHASSGANVSASSNVSGQHQILNHASGNITSPQHHHHDEQTTASTPTSANSAAVSTTTSLSPRVVSSSSPSSTSQHQQQQHHATSPSCTQLQCKKCGIMCTNDAELSAHFASMHGGATSPYGSGYSSGQTTTQQQSGGNPGEILDLDSQKMVYPPTPGEYQQIHAGASSDPLHSMHSMQQRALASWEQPTQQQQQQQQEGLPPYLQTDHKSVAAGAAQPPHANQSPYYSPKQSSPYHSIKSEFPIIKTEYAADSQGYVDKSFDPTTANELSCQQQALLPVSSSPAEFPSTTTTPQQDQQQQQQYRAQFEPPTSSSALPASSITTKAATWKSNEARRPKTYNCTACNKWFTSSGHLKRHYNTTLHKNAVKSSGQPDPATLPISVHHHPARDPTTKQSRRVKVDAAAREQQQQASATVQPPEPPRSPPEYVSSQSAGMAALSHYSTSPSPTLHGQVNGMSYAQSQQQQQSGSNNNSFQQQYLQQVQATAINAAGASNASVLNGHPNGLAGPSVHQQQQTLTSSQMRGLLNSTTTTIVTKSEPMEDQPQSQQQPPQRSPMDMHMEMELTPEQQQQQQDHQDMQLAEMEQVLQQQQEAYQLELDQQQQHRPFHSSTPSSTHSSSTHSMRAQSPHIISHQQYLEHLHQQQQQQQQPLPPPPMEDNIFCHTPHTPASIHMPPQQLQQYSIMADQQQYNITVLDTNTIPQQLRLQPQHNNNNMSPPLQHTTTTTATINSMDSIRTMPHSQQLQRQHHLHPHIMSNTLLHNSTSNTLEQQQLPPLDTIRSTIHTLTTTPNTAMPIPSFQQLQQQVVPPEEVLEADPTMSYHTIIGKPFQVHPNDQHSQQLLQLSGQFEHYTQMLTTDGQLVQLIPAQQLLDQQLYRVGTTTDSYAPLTPYSAQRSPQEGDLPPSDDDMQALESSSSALNGGLPAYSPTDSNCSTLTAPMDNYSNNNNNTGLMPADTMIVAATKPQSTPAAAKPRRSTTGGSSQKRKRNPSSSSSSTLTPGSLLPSGRIQCQQCDKTFAKNCYLTQHINCFHAGEYPFRCEKCGKRFQLEEPYEVHLERHRASEKAHKCHLCPKHYHHKTDLRRHIEGTHTQKKPHACEICEKSFCRYDHLLKHMDTHNRPRVIGKRSAAANNKIKSAFESAGHSVEMSDNVANSIDNVVSNSASTSASYSAIVHVQTNNNDCDMRNIANANVVSADQKILIIDTVECDDHEMLRENANDDGGNSTYITLSSEIDIKQEYTVEQEIPIY